MKKKAHSLYADTITSGAYMQDEQIIHFLSLFLHSLSVCESKSEIDKLMQDLCALSRDELLRVCSEGAVGTQARDLIHDIIVLLRNKVFTFFSQGAVCDVNYFAIFVWFDLVEIEEDTRFYVFENMAYASLYGQTKESIQSSSHQVSTEFMPHFASNNDSENILFIELYMLAKSLRSFHSHNALVREYIYLISLIDINLPAALTHANFIVKNNAVFGISMKNLLIALSSLLKTEIYFSYTPMQRRSILNWQLHCFWNVPHFFNHHAWLELYPLWRTNFYACLNQGEVEAIDEAMYMQFFIYHFCGNNFHHQTQWREFCEEIDKVGARAYERFAKMHGIYGSKNLGCSTSSRIDKKKRIGILRDRLVANSPYKVEYSLLSNLMNDKDFVGEYEIKIYTMKILEKSNDDESIIEHYRALGIEVVDVVSSFNTQGFYNSHLQKALALKEAINRDEIEILISPNNGYGISDFILASRSAPLQVYYSHGNFVYDLPCLDLKMTHICQNKPRIVHEGYEFVGVSVKMQDRFYNPPLDKNAHAEISRIRADLGADCIVVGTIGRLSKIQSREYWQCVIESMRPYPQSIYMACGGGNSALIQDIILSCFDDILEAKAFLARVYFTGYIDSVLYGHIIDIWLDSFPHEQGESRIEYLAKGGLSLVMSKNSQDFRAKNIAQWVGQWAHSCNPCSTDLGEDSMQEREQEAYDILANGHLPLVAFDKEDYITKAKSLIALFAHKEHESIEKLRSIVARGREISDELRQAQGVDVFKQSLLRTKNNVANL